MASRRHKRATFKGFVQSRATQRFEARSAYPTLPHRFTPSERDPLRCQACGAYAGLDRDKMNHPA